MARVVRRSRPATAVKLMGLDASLNGTGMAHPAGTGAGVVTHRVNPGTKRGSSRLWHNLKKLQERLEEAQPGVVFLEGYAMNAKGNVFQLGEWGGILRLELWRRKIDVYTVTPGTLKYAATGSGAAKKPEMVQACADLFNYHPSSHDEADAYLLYQYGRAYLYKQGPQEFVHRVHNPRDPRKPGVSFEQGMR